MTNLEKAAEEYARVYLDFTTREEILESFLAGASWHKESPEYAELLMIAEHAKGVLVGLDEGISTVPGTLRHERLKFHVERLERYRTQVDGSSFTVNQEDKL